MTCTIYLPYLRKMLRIRRDWQYKSMMKCADEHLKSKGWRELVTILVFRISAYSGFSGVQVRMQTMPKPSPGEGPLYSGAWDCAKKSFSNGGIKVLYRGMSAPLSSVTLSNSMYFLGYSIGKRIQQVIKTFLQASNIYS